MNFDSLKLYRVYLASLSVSVDTKGLIQIYKEKERKKSSSFVDVLQSIRPGIKTFHVVVVQWM